MRVASGDTIRPPFIDDFSIYSNYPDQNLWMDRNVYINNNYSADPVTIGTATFDGLNEFGNPYHPGSTFDSVADFLTSTYINLDSILPGDTSVWLNFYYQPQGLGDEPEPADSLILQFKDTAGNWTNVWSVPGRADTAFQKVSIHLIDSNFYNGFQFRFYNIATVSGNRDHWNLDYVILDKKTFIADFGMLHPQLSLLNEFTAMPYSHYKSPGIAASFMKTEIKDTIVCLDYSASVVPFVNISDITGLDTTFDYPFFSILMNAQSKTADTIPINNFLFPSYSNDSMDFVVKSCVQSTSNQYRLNDTSYLYQHFHNYYSYDDGSAEAAYGIVGNTDVWAAYQFNVQMQDTLRGVQIYFNPTGIDITNKLFQLTVWSDVNVATNQSVELYRMINQKPDTFDGINVFKTYLFDIPLVVGPGNIWVGMIQNEPQTLYGIGLDRNIDSRNKMFYHLDGFWYQSSIAGSWMIRPLFGKRISLVGIDEAKKSDPSFSLYPNPASNRIFLKSDERKEYTYQIFNSIGKLIEEKETNGVEEIDISAFAKGIYILKLTNALNSFSTRKFIVQ